MEASRIDFGIEYFNYYRNVKTSLSKNDIDNLEQRAGEYLKKLLQELVQRLPLSINHFKGTQALSPGVCLSKTIKLKFLDLPLIDTFINKKDLFKAESEYNSLNNVDWDVLYGKDILIDSYRFWPIVAQHKDAGGSLAFNIIAEFALKILSLPMSNATVERIFSIMNATKDKLRNRMATEMLNSILTIKSHAFTNNYCCKNFVCTQNMFEKFNNSIYNNETESEHENNDFLILETVNGSDYNCT
jgi:hypothetical protein